VVLEEDKKKLLNTVSDAIEDSATQGTESGVALLVIGVSLAVMIGSLITFGSLKSKQSAIDSLDLSIKNDVTAPLAALEKEQEQIATIKSQLGSLKTALNSREEFGKILSDISSNQIKKSQLTTLSIQENDVALSGSVDNYSDLSKLVAAYRNLSTISEVKLSSATTSDESKKIEFSMSMKIDRSKYKVKGATKETASTSQKTGSSS